MVQVSFRSMCVTIVAAALLGVAGCGDGSLSKSEYIAQNNAIQKSAMASMGSISTLDPSKPAAAATQVLAVKKDLDAAIVKLEALKPPSDWTDEHADMVKAVKSTSAALGALATAVRTEDVAGMKAASTKLTTSNVSFRAAINAINSSR